MNGCTVYNRKLKVSTKTYFSNIPMIPILLMMIVIEFVCISIFYYNIIIMHISISFKPKQLKLKPPGLVRPVWIN